MNTQLSMTNEDQSEDFLLEDQNWRVRQSLCSGIKLAYGMLFRDYRLAKRFDQERGGGLRIKDMANLSAACTLRTQTLVRECESVLRFLEGLNQSQSAISSVRIYSVRVGCEIALREYYSMKEGVSDE